MPPVPDRGRGPPDEPELQPQTSREQISTQPAVPRALGGAEHGRGAARALPRGPGRLPVLFYFDEEDFSHRPVFRTLWRTAMSYWQTSRPRGVPHVSCTSTVTATRRACCCSPGRRLPTHSPCRPRGSLESSEDSRGGGYCCEAGAPWRLPCSPGSPPSCLAYRCAGRPRCPRRRGCVAEAGGGCAAAAAGAFRGGAAAAAAGLPNVRSVRMQSINDAFEGWQLVHPRCPTKAPPAGCAWPSATSTSANWCRPTCPRAARAAAGARRRRALSADCLSWPGPEGHFICHRGILLASASQLIEGAGTGTGRSRGGGWVNGPTSY